MEDLGHQGSLCMRTRKFFFPKWKKYWFEIRSRSLVYYSSQAKAQEWGKSKGSIELCPKSEVRVSASSFGFTFKVCCGSKMFYLSSATEVDRQLWISKLQALTQSPLPISGPFQSERVSGPKLNDIFWSPKEDAGEEDGATCLSKTNEIYCQQEVRKRIVSLHASFPELHHADSKDTLDDSQSSADPQESARFEQLLKEYGIDLSWTKDKQPLAPDVDEDGNSSAAKTLRTCLQNDFWGDF